jgi:hypothetical protein
VHLLEPSARLAAEDVRHDLEVVSTVLPGLREDRASCRDPDVAIVLAPIGTGIDAQTYSIEEQRCGRGRLITLSGGSVASLQWAAYDFMRILGVRYFHPEQTYYPAALQWPLAPIHKIATPRLRMRSIHVHRTHPVELLAPLFTDLDMQRYQQNWLDWNARQRHTHVDAVDGAALRLRERDRGFARFAGINLMNQQQGGKPLLGADSDADEARVLADAIEASVQPDPRAAPIRDFGFGFQPTEFTTIDPQRVVDRLTFISDHLSQHHPQLRQWAINHATYGEPTALGPRYNDLGELAPPALGAVVHVLMFYGLDRAAPVYGNQSFDHQRRWIEQQAQVRRVRYYPESSWWLTFDLPVPLFLAPATIEARSRDLQILEPLVVQSDDEPTGVHGHHLFSSGQEWGYWFIDWCVAQMTFTPGWTYTDCIDDFSARFAGAATLARVLKDAAALQSQHMRDPEIVALLVGSDDDTELAAQAGIAFHPLPPSPASVLADAAALPLTELAVLADVYAGWADEVEALLAAQRPQDVSWVAEVADGLRIMALRAAHAHTIYKTVAALRAALGARDLDAVALAETGLDRARGITRSAEQVIRRREAQYRYPAELTIAGNERGSPGALANGTEYPYRYLSRTHRLFYWHRPDDQLAALFGEGLELVRVNGRILTEDLQISLAAEPLQPAVVHYGDGAAPTTALSHHYGSLGLYDWRLDAVLSDRALHHEDQVAIVSERFVFPVGSVHVTEPPSASLLDGMLPGWVVGIGEGEWVLGRLDDAEPISARGSLVVRTGGQGTSGPQDFAIPFADGQSLQLYATTLDLDRGAGTLTISGSLRPAEVVAYLAGTDAFDEAGAISIVASVLDVPADDLPAEIPLRAVAQGE